MKKVVLFLLLISSVANAQTVKTIAGCGITGFSGDNGPATAAKLNLPNTLAFDKKATSILWMVKIAGYAK